MGQILAFWAVAARLGPRIEDFCPSEGFQGDFLAMAHTNPVRKGKRHQPEIVGAITANNRPAALVECRICRRRFAVSVKNHRTEITMSRIAAALPTGCPGRAD